MVPWGPTPIGQRGYRSTTVPSPVRRSKAGLAVHLGQCHADALGDTPRWRELSAGSIPARRIHRAEAGSPAASHDAFARIRLFGERLWANAGKAGIRGAKFGLRIAERGAQCVA
jgi:hypothetical protein